MKKEGIRTIEVKKDATGNYESVRLDFGPHYYVELHQKESDAVTLTLGATHHGFKADASEVGGELEKIIYEVRRRYPHTLVD